MMKINAIITGTTGMVGKAVLLECLADEHVASVLVINRKSIRMSHPKLKEIIHVNFEDISTIKDQLNGYNACFFCMGVSSVGMNEEKYTQITYTITAHFADVLYDLNPDMVFNYVSGAGTDSSEKGSTMWARVKGKTENYILHKGFKSAYMFRPGVIIPEKGIKSSTSLYNVFYVIFRPLFPLLRKMKSITTTTKLGKAMMNTVIHPPQHTHLENPDINTLSIM